MIKKPVFPKQYEIQSFKVLNEAFNQLKPYLSWKKIDPGNAADIDLRYRKLPFLTKKDLREFGWQEFVSLGKDIDRALKNGEISLVQTSGTTEDKVTNVWNQEWWDKTEQWSWEYNRNFKGLEYGKSREAILTSPHNTGFLSNEMNLSKEKRKLERFLYLNEKSSPALWDDDLMERMRQELNDFKPLVLEANPSYLAVLSDYLARSGRQVFQPQVIVFSFENYSLLSKKIIQSAFTSPVASSFGSTEAGCVLMECEEGRYHQNTASCRIDFQPFHPDFGPEDTGRIFVTTFDNPWRVMIRFDIGDLVRLNKKQQCGCGKRHGFIFDQIEGRVSNLTFNTLGKCVTPRELDNQISLFEGILNYQLIQKSASDYHLLLVSRPSVSNPKNFKGLIEKLKLLYGERSNITLEKVSQIQAESSGKYRHSKCDVPFDANHFFLSGDEAWR